jgi:hypothetical protein
VTDRIRFVTYQGKQTLLPMNVHELGEEYRDKTDKELLRVALPPEQLTPEAHVARNVELVSSGMDSEANLKVARKEEEERKAENDRELGRLGLFFP